MEMGIEQGFGVIEKLAAAETGFDQAFDLGQHLGDDRVRGELGVGGVLIDAEGAAVVSEVTAEGGAKVEDEEFPCLSGARAWWATW